MGRGSSSIAKEIVLKLHFDTAFLSTLYIYLRGDV